MTAMATKTINSPIRIESLRIKPNPTAVRSPAKRSGAAQQSAASAAPLIPTAMSARPSHDSLFILHLLFVHLCFQIQEIPPTIVEALNSRHSHNPFTEGQQRLAQFVNPL